MNGPMTRQTEGNPDAREVVLAARNVAKSYGNVHALKGVNFDFDKSTLRPDAIAILNEAVEILKRYPAGKEASATIPLLYVVQRQMGRQTGSAWVPRVAMDQVAKRLGMAPIRVYEVASFYFMFNTKPIGRYHLQVCGTTPCMLRGAGDLRIRFRGFGGGYTDRYLLAGAPTAIDAAAAACSQPS